MNKLDSSNIDNIKVERSNNLANNIVIIDGQPGCGKTLFSTIISSFKRVEILNYAFDIEYIARLFSINKIKEDAAISLILMFADLKLYQTMMGRETNFRYSDLSSVFRNPYPLRYFSRIFSKGDKNVPLKIKQDNPILSLTTHNLLNYSEPVFKAFGSKLSFIEIVRHPLYMIKQQTINMRDLNADNPRDVDLYINYNGVSIPYYAIGWEQKFINSNIVEKAIYNIENIYKINKNKRNELNKNTSYKILTIPFEKFVTNPDDYLSNMINFLKTEFSHKTSKILSKQKIPRNKIADGINLPIYKRYLWEPSDKNLSEKDELSKRRKWAINMGANKNSIETLDRISEDYNKLFLN